MGKSGRYTIYRNKKTYCLETKCLTNIRIAKLAKAKYWRYSCGHGGRELKTHAEALCCWLQRWWRPAFEQGILVESFPAYYFIAAAQNHVFKHCLESKSFPPIFPFLMAETMSLVCKDHKNHRNSQKYNQAILGALYSSRTAYWEVKCLGTVIQHTKC